MNGNSSIQSGTSDESFELVSLLKYIISFWYWIAAAVLLCIVAVLLLDKSNSRKYASSATVMFSSSSSNPLPETLSGIQQTVPYNIRNEIAELQSRSILTKVIEANDMDVDYLTYTGRKLTDSYDTTPVKVRFDRKTLRSQSFVMEVTPLSSSTIRISGKDGEVIDAAPGDSVTVDGNTVMLECTDNFDESCFGRTITVKKTAIGLVSHHYQQSLKVTRPDPSASVIELEHKGTSPRRACEFLQNLLDSYNKISKSHREIAVKETTEMLEGKLRVMEKDLSDLGVTLARLKKEKAFMDANDTSTGYIKNNSENQRLVEYRSQLRFAEYLREKVGEDRKCSRMIIADNGIESEELNMQVKEYNESYLLREKLLKSSGPTNPTIVKLDETLGFQREGIISNLDNLISGLKVKAEYSEMIKKEQLEIFNSKPTNIFDIENYERTREIKESQYAELRNNLEKINLVKYSLGDAAVLIDSPEENPEPVNSSLLKLLAIGIILGCLLPTFVLLIVFICDGTIRSGRDMNALGNMGIRFLGCLPRFGVSRNRLLSRINGEFCTTSRFEESCRMICMDERPFTGGEALSVVITTSSLEEGDGKSMVIKNMAYCFAETGKKVVLVDMDLRSASLSSDYFNLVPKEGYTDYIMDSRSIDELIYRDKEHNIDFIPAGKNRTNPVTLLLNPKTKEFVDELKNRYDYVLLDNVTAGSWSDSVIINKQVDKTIFVLSAGNTKKYMLSILRTYSDQGRYNDISCILNNCGTSNKYILRYGRV